MTGTPGPGYVAHRRHRIVRRTVLGLIRNLHVLLGTLQLYLVVDGASGVFIAPLHHTASPITRYPLCGSHCQQNAHA